MGGWPAMVSKPEAGVKAVTHLQLAIAMLISCYQESTNLAFRGFIAGQVLEFVMSVAPTEMLDSMDFCISNTNLA